MRLIVTHEKPDFDAIAGLALARLAHPGSVAVTEGDLPDGVREFLHLYRDELELRRGEEIDLDEVSELIVVDTNDGSRLGRFGALVGRVPVTVYDHHPRHDGELPAAHGIQEQVGSTATLLTRHLQASNMNIPAQIASLALLAIHEDTGNLTYDHTTADDYRSAAHLMRCGASLQVVREFETELVDEERRELLQKALTQVELRDVAGHRLAVASFVIDEYVRDAAGVCNGLLERTGADGAVLAVAMEGKTLVFARAHRGFDVGAALARSMDGGGHQGAAFAHFEGDPQEAIRAAVEALAAAVLPAPQARDVMTTPVKSIEAGETVGQAGLLLTRYGHNGAPVVEEGRLVGVISRRDLDRALRHDLEEATVSGFMTRDVVTAAPETSLAELERMVLTHNIGRIPIVAEGELVGIVTRSDLLAAHHPTGESAVAERIRERLPTEALRIVQRAAALAQQAHPKAALYLVGGTVRDALLGRALSDLDLVTENASAQSLVSRLQGELGGAMSFHATFGTSSLTLPSGLTVDVAGAREEYYPHPGSLPEVIPSSIRKDLARRDFTVNAMTLRLCPEPLQLLDPYDGVADLERRQLRTLHPLSFIEDPTRILRGARLGGRLGFEFSREARRQAVAALEGDALSGVSGSRLRAELELTFAEARVAPALALLDSLGGLEATYGLSYPAELVQRLDAARSAREIPDLSYLLALLLGTPLERALAHLERFHWPLRLRDVRARLARAEQGDELSEEALLAADEAEIELLRVLSPGLEARVIALTEQPQRRRLRGRDVLELGLQPGPEVGEVLDEVSGARQQGRLTSFEEELEFARTLVQARLAKGERE